MGGPQYTLGKTYRLMAKSNNNGRDDVAFDPKEFFLPPKYGDELLLVADPKSSRSRKRKTTKSWRFQYTDQDKIDPETGKPMLRWIDLTEEELEKHYLAEVDTVDGGNGI